MLLIFKYLGVYTTTSMIYVYRNRGVLSFIEYWKLVVRDFFSFLF